MELNFLSPKTVWACFLPLRSNASLIGCIIFENADEKRNITVSQEYIMIHIADIFVTWMAEKTWEWEPQLADENDFSEESAEGFIPAHAPMNSDEAAFVPLKQLKGLDAESALEAMGGYTDVYIKTLRLTVKLMPETLEKLKHLAALDDLREFIIEIHGLKSVLNNIGAYDAGVEAAKLEKAAVKNDRIYCETHLIPFIENATALYEQAQAILSEGLPEIKEASAPDTDMLLQALETAESAAAGFDNIQAMEALAGFSGGAFYKKIERALESFNYENALSLIKEWKEGMRNGLLP
jgi:HPt (histidine-containing phosphotransfer) domain-containing protein